MAIPGIINETQSAYTEAEYRQELTPLVGILGDTNVEVSRFVMQCLEELRTNANIIVTDSQGNMDLSKLKTATFQTVLDKDIRFISYGEESLNWPMGFWGYYEGQVCCFLNAAADDAATAWAQPMSMQLQVPKLYISHKTGTIEQAEWNKKGQGFNFVSTQFVATFTTRWGETQPSNSVSIYYQLDSPAWVVTLEVIEDDIPRYAEAVRYYQYIDNAFYLMSEVEI